MKKIHLLRVILFIISPNTYAMEKPSSDIVALKCVSDVGEIIIQKQLLNLHNHAQDLSEIRQTFYNVSLVNQKCNKFTSNIHLLKQLVPNTLRFARRKNYDAVVKELCTPITKRYQLLSNKLFSENLAECTIENLIKEGADPNYTLTMDQLPGSIDITPLVFHINKSTPLPIVELLLNNGAKINQWSGHNVYPLRSAIRNNNPQMVALLLRYNSKIDNGEAPFCNALCDAIEIKNENEEIVNMLIEHSSQKECNEALKKVIQLKKYHLLKNFAHYEKQLNTIFQNIANDMIIEKIDLSDILKLLLEQQSNSQQDYISQALSTTKELKARAKLVISILTGHQKDYENMPDLVKNNIYDENVKK